MTDKEAEKERRSCFRAFLKFHPQGRTFTAEKNREQQPEGESGGVGWGGTCPQVKLSFLLEESQNQENRGLAGESLQPNEPFAARRRPPLSCTCTPTCTRTGRRVDSPALKQTMRDAFFSALRKCFLLRPTASPQTPLEQI